MQRILRIVLLITFMLLIILWFSTIFNTCNKKNKGVTTEEVTANEDSSDVFQELDDEFFEDDQDLFTEEATGNADEGKSTNSESGGTSTDVFDYEDPEDYTDYTGEPSSGTSTSTSRTQGTVNENANYLVVAGSFLVKDNAVRMQQKLQGMGYSAEVRNFNYSQYHSVIAGRYNDKSNADFVSSELKAAGISCYVHKRQP